MRSITGDLAVMQSRVQKLVSVPITVKGILAIVALSICVVGAGCSTGGSSATQSLIKSINAYIPPPLTNGQPSQTSLTLFANTIYLTGGNIVFGQVGNNGGYIQLTSGSYNLAASGPATALTQPIQLQNQTFNGNNTAYTVVAAGQAAQTGPLKPQILVLPNFISGQLTLASGTAAVRVVNVSLNPNPLGLYTTTNKVPSSAVAPTTASLLFGYSGSNNAYSVVATSSLANLAVVDTTAPTVPLNMSTTSNLNTFTFVAGDAYTLYIYGQPNNTTTPLGCTWVQDFPAP